MRARNGPLRILRLRGEGAGNTTAVYDDVGAIAACHAGNPGDSTRIGAGERLAGTQGKERLGHTNRGDRDVQRVGVRGGVQTDCAAVGHFIVAGAPVEPDGKSVRLALAAVFPLVRQQLDSLADNRYVDQREVESERIAVGFGSRANRSGIHDHVVAVAAIDSDSDRPRRQRHVSARHIDQVDFDGGRRDRCTRPDRHGPGVCRPIGSAAGLDTGCTGRRRQRRIADAAVGKAEFDADAFRCRRCVGDDRPGIGQRIGQTVAAYTHGRCIGGGSAVGVPVDNIDFPVRRRGSGIRCGDDVARVDGGGLAHIPPSIPTAVARAVTLVSATVASMRFSPVPVRVMLASAVANTAPLLISVSFANPPSIPAAVASTSDDARKNGRPEITRFNSRTDPSAVLATSIRSSLISMSAPLPP